jgi:hypothetical protein
MSFGTYSNEDVLNIKGYNVGIGYTTPDYKLHVNGVIKGNNIKYNLPERKTVLSKNNPVEKLSNLEDYIKRENQLPGANNCFENDTVVDLGKMNTFLLNKIEELTLYTIQQQKDIETLKSEIENLKNK